MAANYMKMAKLTHSKVLKEHGWNRLPKGNSFVNGGEGRKGVVHLHSNGAAVHVSPGGRVSNFSKPEDLDLHLTKIRGQKTHYLGD